MSGMRIGEPNSAGKQLTFAPIGSILYIGIFYARGA